VKVPRHLTDEQFRKDCAFAGIPLRDDTGAVLDLYAATRHTFCTLLGKAGVAPHRQRLLARHADLATTLRYTHLQVIDLVEGIEALPDLTTEGDVERADYLRNAGCSQVQTGARERNEEGLATGTTAEAEGNVKGLPAQDLANSCKATQEVSNSLSSNELWSRRRESNAPEAHKPAGRSFTRLWRAASSRRAYQPTRRSGREVAPTQPCGAGGLARLGFCS
jgi:hypothetical protein